MLRRALAIALVFCACSKDAAPPQGNAVVTPPPPPPAPVVLPKGGGEWLQYRHDARGASENPAEFTAAEAANLRVRWTAELGQYVYTQAMIGSDVTVFTTAFSGKAVAFDTASGAQRWARDLNRPVSTTCNGDKKVGFWGSAAIAGDFVYAASPDGNLYALRRGDGSTAWSATIADGSAAGHGEFVQSSPAVGLGKVYLGVASSEHCDLIAGRVLSVDVATHAVVKRELLTAGQRGAGVWSSITVAEDEGRIYVASGNEVGGRDGEPLAQAIIAMDAQSLAVLDHWQNPTPLENSDFGSSPTIFDAAGGKYVAATSKDGWLYVLRRDSLAAGPAWKYQLAVIDPNDPTVGGNPTRGYGSISTPAFASGRLYAAGGRTPQGEVGSVVGFDPPSGNVLWKHVTPGYVIAPLAAAGEVLAVESSAPDGTSSTLEILEQSTGRVVKSFPGAIATFGAPAIGRGVVTWTDAYGHAQVFEVPDYR